MTSTILYKAVIPAADLLGYSFRVDREQNEAIVRGLRLPLEFRIRANDVPAYAILGAEYFTRVPLCQRPAVRRLLLKPEPADRAYRIAWAMDFGFVRASVRMDLNNTAQPDLRVKYAFKLLRKAVERKVPAITRVVSGARLAPVSRRGARRATRLTSVKEA